MLKHSIQATGVVFFIICSGWAVANPSKGCTNEQSNAAEAVSFERMKNYKSIAFIGPKKNRFGNLAFLYEVSHAAYKTVYTVNMNCFTGKPKIDWIDEVIKPN